jgi:hypothetical protein
LNALICPNPPNPDQLILDPSLLRLEGLQCPSQRPKDGFSIIRVMPACPQLQNKLSL